MIRPPAPTITTRRGRSFPDIEFIGGYNAFHTYEFTSGFPSWEPGGSGNERWSSPISIIHFARTSIPGHLVWQNFRPECNGYFARGDAIPTPDTRRTINGIHFKFGTLSTMVFAISSEAVAAGEGALQTCRKSAPSLNKKSSTNLPSAIIA